MKLTWYGHAAFKIEANGASILIDPFLSGSPVFPENLSVDEVAEGVTHVLLTHGHDDHVGDSIEILKKTGAQLTGDADLIAWAAEKGIENLNPMNSGGNVNVGPFSVAMTVAHHSSGYSGDGGKRYMGTPHGLVIDIPGEPKIYHMGDTDIFSDMALVNELHEPKVGIVPVGDRFTMGGKAAALACNRYFNFDTIIPCHFGTFPLLEQTADTFVTALGDSASKVKLPQIGVPFEI